MIFGVPLLGFKISAKFNLCCFQIQTATKPKLFLVIFNLQCVLHVLSFPKCIFVHFLGLGKTLILNFELQLMFSFSNITWAHPSAALPSLLAHRMGSRGTGTTPAATSAAALLPGAALAHLLHL